MGDETGSEVLTRVLLDAGIEVCFANPGTTEMHLVDALSADERVKCILGLHETVCTGAADGYARMKGHAACTLLHLGPGDTRPSSSSHRLFTAPSCTRALIALVPAAALTQAWQTASQTCTTHGVPARPS